MYRSLFVILCITLLTGCNFNKIVLQPYALSSTTKRIAFAADKDSIVVFISGKDHQPVFTKNGKDTLALSYTIEGVTFKSTNGNQINGWFLKSKTQPATATILHLHGNCCNLFYQYQGMAALLKYGFQAFVFDYSGFGFSEGQATRENVLADALSAVDYLKTRPDVLNTKLVLYGQSLGGHLSAVVAAQRQSDIDALVIEGAFSSHKDIAAHQVHVIGRLIMKQGYRATASIKDYHKPLLVIHSKEDEVVPFKLGRKIFDAANDPKEFYEIYKCHICGPQFYADSISNKIKHLLPSQSE